MLFLVAATLSGCFLKPREYVLAYGKAYTITNDVYVYVAVYDTELKSTVSYKYKFPKGSNIALPRIKVNE